MKEKGEHVANIDSLLMSIPNASRGVESLRYLCQGVYSGAPESVIIAKPYKI